MAEWTAIGDLVSGIPGRLSWNGTSLSGTPEAMTAVHELAALGPVPLTPTGPWLAPNLNDEAALYAIAVLVLRAPDTTGDPPDLAALIPDVPEDAVA